MPETEHGNPIDRREAIRQVTVLLGGVALVGGSSLVAACERAQRGVGAAGAGAGGAGTFSAQDVVLLDEVAETILPETKTPGAKAAHVGAFMALMVTDTYEDREQKAYMDGKADDAPAHYFRLMKELTLLGYFTSEIGCTQAQRYRERPGRFDACVPYTPGESAWAGHA